MIRLLMIASVLTSSLLIALHLAEGESIEPARRPLDLPVSGVGEEEEEEDEPESITFYGADYEGDGFFWCLDKSCSMDGTQMLILKQEVSQALQSLSRNADLGLVAFSTNVVRWQSFPVRATVGNKAQATSWVQNLAAGGGTIFGPAGVATLQVANQSHQRKRTLIVLGDGLPSDETEALSSVTGANYQNLPINTILISDTSGVGFMQSLASQNEGSYRFIP